MPNNWDCPSPTVVRNVLLNTFQLVEGVVTDSTKLARAIQGRKPRTPPHRLVAPAGSGWC